MFIRVLLLAILTCAAPEAPLSSQFQAPARCFWQQLSNMHVNLLSALLQVDAVKREIIKSNEHCASHMVGPMPVFVCWGKRPCGTSSVFCIPATLAAAARA